MGLGYTIISIFMDIGNEIFGRTTEALYNPMLLLSFFAGFLWMIGQLLFINSIDKIGMSRSNQWKNLQGPIGSILILIFFQEAISTNLIFLLLAISIIFLSAMLFTIKKDNKTEINKRGILYAAISAIFFGTNALLRKYVTNAGFIYMQQVYSSIAVFLTALVYILIKDSKLLKFYTHTHTHTHTPVNLVTT